MRAATGEKHELEEIVLRTLSNAVTVYAAQASCVQSLLDLLSIWRADGRQPERRSEANGEHCIAALVRVLSLHASNRSRTRARAKERQLDAT